MVYKPKKSRKEQELAAKEVMLKLCDLVNKDIEAQKNEESIDYIIYLISAIHLSCNLAKYSNLSEKSFLDLVSQYADLHFNNKGEEI